MHTIRTVLTNNIGGYVMSAVYSGIFSYLYVAPGLKMALLMSKRYPVTLLVSAIMSAQIPTHKLLQHQLPLDHEIQPQYLSLEYLGPLNLSYTVQFHHSRYCLAVQ